MVEKGIAHSVQSTGLLGNSIFVWFGDLKNENIEN